MLKPKTRSCVENLDKHTSSLLAGFYTYVPGATSGTFSWGHNVGFPDLMWTIRAPASCDTGEPLKPLQLTVVISEKDRDTTFCVGQCG